MAVLGTYHYSRFAMKVKLYDWQESNKKAVDDSTAFCGINFEINGVFQLRIEPHYLHQQAAFHQYDEICIQTDCYPDYDHQ